MLIGPVKKYVPNEALRRHANDLARLVAKLPARVRVGLAIVAVFLFCILAIGGPRSVRDPGVHRALRPQPSLVGNLPGGDWSGFKQIFAFGDSWSTIAYDIFGEQPNEQNPFGNPQIPQNGTTHPPNYLQFLTTTYNASLLRTYVIAEGAATIDRNIVPPHEYLDWTKPFKEQVNDKFAQFYHPASPRAAWDPNRTLFIIWFGVVDVSLLIDRKNPPEDITSRNINSYANSIYKLYELGARHFLLLTIPPMYMSPSAREEGHNPTLERQLIIEFNEKMIGMRNELVKQHSDASAYLFDVHGLLTKIITTPEMVFGTEHLKNTTENCWKYNPDAYQEAHPWDWFEDECGIPLDEYFWANPLHPTHPAHNATAAAIVADCMGAIRTGFCS